MNSYTPPQDSAYQNPDATCSNCDFTAKFTITLSDVLEGENIYIKNKTNGIPSKPWDINWQGEFVPTNGPATYLGTNNFNQGQQLQLTVPIVGGVPLPLNPGYVQHKLYLAVNYGSQGWGGLCTSTDCPTRRVLIFINVKDIRTV